MASVAPRIALLTDIFMAAAFADARLVDEERLYVRRLLCDLLCTKHLSPEVERRIERFDPLAFDLQATAEDFRRDPPMSRRRMLELVSYVTLADGRVLPAESTFLRSLADALGVPEREYADLLQETDELGPRDSFIDRAPVPVPYPRGDN